MRAFTEEVAAKMVATQEFYTILTATSSGKSSYLFFFVEYQKTLIDLLLLEVCILNYKKFNKVVSTIIELKSNLKSEKNSYEIMK